MGYIHRCLEGREIDPLERYRPELQNKAVGHAPHQKQYISGYHTQSYRIREEHEHEVYSQSDAASKDYILILKQTDPRIIDELYNKKTHSGIHADHDHRNDGCNLRRCFAGCLSFTLFGIFSKSQKMKNADQSHKGYNDTGTDKEPRSHRFNFHCVLVRLS